MMTNRTFCTYFIRWISWRSIKCSSNRNNKLSYNRKARKCKTICRSLCIRICRRSSRSSNIRNWKYSSKSSNRCSNIIWIKFNRAKNNNRKSKPKESSSRNSNGNGNIRSSKQGSKEVPK